MLLVKTIVFSPVIALMWITTWVVEHFPERWY